MESCLAPWFSKSAAQLRISDRRANLDRCNEALTLTRYNKQYDTTWFLNKFQNQVSHLFKIFFSATLSYRRNDTYANENVTGTMVNERTLPGRSTNERSSTSPEILTDTRSLENDFSFAIPPLICPKESKKSMGFFEGFSIANCALRIRSSTSDFWVMASPKAISFTWLENRR